MKKTGFLDNRYARTGFWGALVASICCFTPLLVWIFATAGLATYIVWLDYVLIPALAIFLALFIYGWKNEARVQQLW